MINPAYVPRMRPVPPIRRRALLQNRQGTYPDAIKSEDYDRASRQGCTKLLQVRRDQPSLVGDRQPEQFANQEYRRSGSAGSGKQRAEVGVRRNDHRAALYCSFQHVGIGRAGADGITHVLGNVAVEGQEVTETRREVLIDEKSHADGRSAK